MARCRGVRGWVGGRVAEPGGRLFQAARTDDEQTVGARVGEIVGRFGGFQPEAASAERKGLFFGEAMPSEPLATSGKAADSGARKGRQAFGGAVRFRPDENVRRMLGPIVSSRSHRARS